MNNYFCRDVCLLLAGPAPQPDFALVSEEATWPAPPDEELIEAVRQVCTAGWFRALANRMNVADLLDDIEQTTFLNVWRARDTFDPAFPVVCRVARIGRNVLIDMARQRSRRRAVSLYDEEGEQRHDPADRAAGPVEMAVARETEGRLRSAVATAPEQIKRILALLDQEMTFEQAATVLGRKKSAITSAYHRWKVATLRNVLGE
jgi:RNA polymerase sigma factor (sigma-70 family)